MNCPECQTSPRECHRLGCEWEQCPHCGEHWVDCDCLPALNDRLAWMGCCSWLDACIEFGFSKKKFPESGFPVEVMTQSRNRMSAAFRTNAVGIKSRKDMSS